MAEPPDTIPEEEFRKWLKPTKAVELVAKATGDWNVAQQAILRRAITSTEVRIAVRAESIEYSQGNETRKFHPFCPVPDRVLKGWEASELGGNLDLWRSNGDALWVFRPVSGSFLPTKWRFYNIRFDPVGIAKLAGIEPPTPSQPKPLVETGTDAAEPPDTRKPVSQSHLEQWAHLFNKLYPDAPEELGVKSAKGMFPDKSVGRDRVRPLLPKRERGRRPTAK